MSTKEELAKLKQRKRVTKASITRIENFMKDMDCNTVDIDELKLKTTRLDELWQTLLEIQIDITVYDNEITDEQADLETAYLEEKYMHLKLIAGRTMDQRVRPASVVSNIDQASEIVNHTRGETHETLVRLPKIDLPSFSGAYEDWHPFFDIFNSLIHSNNSLKDIQKFHYLKSALKGDAAETIASIEISGINYADAWSRLRERYENERLAVQNHIKAIFELPILRKENCVTLRNILDGVLKHTRALQALKRPTAHWDDLLIHIITGKLDFITLKEWENSLEGRELPTFPELVEFLKRRCQTLEAVARRIQLATSNINSRYTNNAKVTTSHAAVVNAKCAHCKGDHQIFQCKSFRELSVAERLSKVKSMNLCLNCLKGKHIAKDCTSSHCRKCSKKHSTLLHEDRIPSKDNKENGENVKTDSDLGKTVNSVCAYSQFKEVSNINQVLLATAIVMVRDQNGHYVEGRALLDNGSQSSFMTEDFFKKLKLTAMENRVEINGVNLVVSHATKTANLKVTSRFGTFGTELQCIILPNVTKNLPEARFDVTRLNIPSNIRLADPQFNIPNKIDILIGAERVWELLCIGQIRLGKNLPVLQKTLLGWIVAGPLGITGLKQRAQTQCNLSKIEQLNETIHKFWEIESYDQANTTCLNSEEAYCEKLFRETYRRQQNGRFIVKLPVKEEELAILSDSKEIALKRFLTLERKFAREPELKAEYVKFMGEYLKSGHMRHKLSTQGTETRVFLPHHAVVKEDSVTTKTRVVFDASSKGITGKSLNDALYKGPILQQDLFTLIVRFRCFKYVLCADISKMYRQVLIQEEQIPLQSILWREDPESEIEEFELLTITYGTKPASFLAVRCLHQLAELEKENFPKAAEVITRDFYMDDLLTGGNTVQEIRDLKSELIELLAKGGFELHKWNTNLSCVNDDRQDDKAVDINKTEGSKLLGILWKPYKDTFHYQAGTRDRDGRVTKRVILSQICKLFDPMGLVGPVITLAKILMQRLWSLGLDWDESVPMDVYEAWSQMRSQLHLLNTLKIPRLILSGEAESQIQLHGFCDANERAYGACIYLREAHTSNKITVSLVCSKSRVAPIKAVSLPRLELCGAVLLANLMSKVRASLNIEVNQRFFWSDSKIVLAWIKSDSRKWQAFVANRVSEIHDNSSPSEWHHIKSQDNPADLISRGRTSEQLILASSWWKGPDWLQVNSKAWPKESEELPSKDLPEGRKQTVIAIAIKKETIIDCQRYSTLNKLLRVVAYILRFIYNVKVRYEQRRLGSMSVSELNEAKLAVVRIIQSEEFKEELSALKRDSKVSAKSRLRALQPFLDQKGIIRVGGRLKHTELPEETKHPIVIPSAHHFTNLIITHYHEKLFHAGTQTTLNTIREEFWPILARSKIKGIIHKCVRCRKANPRASCQLMGQLPPVRVNFSRPFSNSGVDYCGPFCVRDRTRRNAKQYKAYVAIFVCMVTKAVHIELVEDLTAESFIAALKRFVARRGKVSNLYSDNGRNFVGAERILQQTWENEEFKECIQRFATSEQMNWHFIPPRSPHFGGMWEAAVRSMKLHLKRTIGEICFTIAEMTTILVQIEAILNSRPLTQISDDPDDMRALTPGHFLVGESLQGYPEQELKEVPDNRLTRWQRAEQVRQHLWSRWQKEYLNTCQQRGKWQADTKKTYQVGQLVMVKEAQSMPLKWVLARIVEVHPGSDGVVRVVTLRTEKGVYKRAIVNIAPLLE